MRDEVTTKCNQIIKFADEEKKIQLFINEAPIYLWLVAPWIIYVILNVVISAIDAGNFTDALALGLSLFNYLLLLKLVSIAYLHIKTKLVEKSAQDILISPEKLADIAVFFLAFASAYFGIIGLIEGIRHDDWSSLEIAFLTLTLYAGFTVSLDELFDKEEPPTLWYRLTKPFRRTKISVPAVIWGIVIVMVSALPNIWECVLFVYLALILVFLGGMKLLGEIRRRKLLIWEKKLTILLNDKRTLIYQLGTDSVVKHALEKTLMAMGVEIINVETSDSSNFQYDTVIILNSLIKREQALPDIKVLSSVLNDGGIIVDPFITKRKHRCKLAAAFGLPSSKITGLSLNEYLGVIER